VTWRWTARESHGIAVHSGPQHFTTAARNGARFTHRFEHAGTYEVVCPLHAPGMRMTVMAQ